MRISQIFEHDPKYLETLSAIAEECKTFLSDSRGLPVFKALPNTYADLQRVKVRKHRNNNRFSQTFNEAFGDRVRDLRQRAIFTNSQVFAEEPEKDLFYVFPKDGYSFMYCTEVTHSTKDYQQVFDSLFEQFDRDKAEQLIHDVLKFAYVQENLYEGIEKQVEIIFYNVPYYYAARVDVFEYDTLLTDLAELSDN